MAAPWLLLGSALAGGVLGHQKNKEDKKNYKEEQRLNAVKARFSPWTGIHPTNPQRPQGTTSAILSGALGALPMGQALAASGLFGGDAATPAADVHAIDPTVGNAILAEEGGPTAMGGMRMDQHGTGQTPYPQQPPAVDWYGGQGWQYDPAMQVQPTPQLPSAWIRMNVPPGTYRAHNGGVMGGY